MGKPKLAGDTAGTGTDVKYRISSLQKQTTAL